MIPLSTIQSSSFYNPGGLTTTEIENTLNHVTGTSIIDYSFRLLDASLNPVSVPGASSSDPAELPPTFIKTASIEMNTTRDVHRQMTLDLAELPGLSYNPLFHRLQPYCDYYDGTYTFDGLGNVTGVTGTRVLHIPRGIFAGVLPDRDLSDQVPMWHMTLYDETWFLQKLNFLNRYVIPAGTNLIEAVTTLLTKPLDTTTPAGCTLAGPNIPISRINIPAASSVAAVDIVYTEDATFLKAINDLLAAGDTPFWPLWQDEFGAFCSAPMNLDPPASGWTFDSSRTYTTTGSGNLIKPPVKQSWADSTKSVNVVKVFCESGQAEAFSAIAENHDSRSIISIENLGRKETEIIKNDQISSQAGAQALADLTLQLRASAAETCTFDHFVVPLSQPHDGITLTVKGQGTAAYTGTGADIDVTYSDGPTLISSDGGPWLLISESEDCASRVQHTVVGITVAI